MHKLPRAPIASLSPAAEGVSKRSQRCHAPALITPSNNQPPELPPHCRASGVTWRAAPEPSGCTPSSCSAHWLRHVQGRTGGEAPTASGFTPVGEGAALSKMFGFTVGTRRGDARQKDELSNRSRRGVLAQSSREPGAQGGAGGIGSSNFSPFVPISSPFYLKAQTLKHFLLRHQENRTCAAAEAPAESGSRSLPSHPRQLRTEQPHRAQGAFTASEEIRVQISDAVEGEEVPSPCPAFALGRGRVLRSSQ